MNLKFTKLYPYQISNITHLSEMDIFIYNIYSKSLIYPTFFFDYVSVFCCSHAVAAEACNFQVLKQMAALYLILWHRQAKDVGLNQSKVSKNKEGIDELHKIVRGRKKQREW